MTLKLGSSAFNHGGEIPPKYTCEAQDISPPLSWQGIPEGTRSLVLIVDDPDAPDPDAPKMIWVHWLVYNIPPETTSLIEGATSESLPVGAQQGVNDWQNASYGGPCPPIGRHRYFHKLYALDKVLMLNNNCTKTEIEKAFKGHVIAQTELIGTYQKSK